jgi:hypothetical protein
MTENNQNSTTADWVDSTTFEASLHIEKGKQRSNILRGERYKTQKTSLWAQKQGVKRDREQVQLETQQIRLEGDKVKKTIASDDLAYLRIYQPMHRVDLGQQLVKKAYKIGANPGNVQSQVSGSLAASTTKVVDFANQTQSEKVDLRNS